MTTTPDNLELLSNAVHDAGAALLALWPGKAAQHATGADLSVQAKADGSLVSAADFRSNEILLSALSTLFPDDAVLSEESAFEPAVLAAKKRVWVIDPLDGTSAFLSGRDDFSVLAGLCEEKRPTVGLMYFPARKIFVIARQGGGAFANGERLRCNDVGKASDGKVYLRNFESRRPSLASPMMDSGLALFKVASGELDAAVIRMTTHREWDIVAPMAVIAEAGGLVTNENGGEIECGTGVIKFQFLIASNRAVHDEMLELVRGVA